MSDSNNSFNKLSNIDSDLEKKTKSNAGKKKGTQKRKKNAAPQQSKEPSNATSEPIKEESMQHQITVIKNVLPQVPHEVVVQTLVKFNGNVEFAIQKLLEEYSKDNDSSNGQKKVPHPSESNATNNVPKSHSDPRMKETQSFTQHHQQQQQQQQTTQHSRVNTQALSEDSSENFNDSNSSLRKLTSGHSSGSSQSQKQNFSSTSGQSQYSYSNYKSYTYPTGMGRGQHPRRRFENAQQQQQQHSRAKFSQTSHNNNTQTEWNSMNWESEYDDEYQTSETDYTEERELSHISVSSSSKPKRSLNQKSSFQSPRSSPSTTLPSTNPWANVSSSSVVKVPPTTTTTTTTTTTPSSNSLHTYERQEKSSTNEFKTKSHTTNTSLSQSEGNNNNSTPPSSLLSSSQSSLSSSAPITQTTTLPPTNTTTPITINPTATTTTTTETSTNFPTHALGSTSLTQPTTVTSSEPSETSSQTSKLPFFSSHSQLPSQVSPEYNHTLLVNAALNNLSGMQAQSNSRIANLYQIIEELKNRVNKLELQCAELRSICQQLLIQERQQQFQHYSSIPIQGLPQSYPTSTDFPTPNPAVNYFAMAPYYNTASTMTLISQDLHSSNDSQKEQTNPPTTYSSPLLTTTASRPSNTMSSIPTQASTQSSKPPHLLSQSLQLQSQLPSQVQSAVISNNNGNNNNNNNNNNNTTPPGVPTPSFVASKYTPNFTDMFSGSTLFSHELMMNMGRQQSSQLQSQPQLQSPSPSPSQPPTQQGTTNN